MSSASTTYVYLAPKPKSSYKQLVIKGRNIFARTLYGRYMSEEEPRTIEEIAVDYNLPIAAVQEAIAYCQSDPPEIREDFAREEALMEATGMNDPNYKYYPSPKLLAPEERARLMRGE
jgi:uncharacterized protein (DUF433 family)